MTRKQFEHKIKVFKDYYTSRVKYEDGHVCKLYPCKGVTIFNLYSYLVDTFKESTCMRIEPFAKFVRIAF